MTQTMGGPDVIADFWEWYERRQKRGQSPLAEYALDRCDETFRRCDWDRFGYWFSVYRRQRRRPRGADAAHRGRRQSPPGDPD